MITVYGKTGCERCKKFKEKLGLMGVTFASVDLGTRDGMANFLAQSDVDSPTLPAVLIDDQWYEYAEAIAEIKRRRENSQWTLSWKEIRKRAETWKI